jgi:hypothetical protein
MQETKTVKHKFHKDTKRMYGFMARNKQHSANLKPQALEEPGGLTKR